MPDHSNMTNNRANSKPEKRRILAPLPLPVGLDALGLASHEESDSLFYLSWRGWELYLARRLGWPAARTSASALLLPDVREPEEDFAALDQLVHTTRELGAGLLGLPGGTPESLPGLTAAIRGYSQMGISDKPGPVLDDRSYLALWAVTEYQARQGELLLAETMAKEQAMWAALKGEADEAAEPGFACIPSSEPDSRTFYAWQCWRRLAAPLLLESDIIVANAARPPEAEDS